MVSCVLNGTDILCSFSSNALFYMNSQTRDQRKPISSVSRPIFKNRLFNDCVWRLNDACACWRARHALV